MNKWLNYFTTDEIKDAYDKIVLKGEDPNEEEALDSGSDSCPSEDNLND